MVIGLWDTFYPSHLLPCSSIWIAVEMVPLGIVCLPFLVELSLIVEEILSPTLAEPHRNSPWCWGKGEGSCWELSVVLEATHFCRELERKLSTTALRIIIALQEGWDKTRVAGCWGFAGWKSTLKANNHMHICSYSMIPTDCFRMLYWFSFLLGGEGKK